MKEKNRLMILCAILAVLCFAAFGYMCYTQAQEHRGCTCVMVRDHECPRP